MRANLIGKGSKETPEPEEDAKTIVNTLGFEDRSTDENASEFDEDGKNIKPRRVSKTDSATKVV